MVFEKRITSQTSCCVIISLPRCSLSKFAVLFYQVINWLIIEVSAIDQYVVIGYVYSSKKIFLVILSFNFSIAISIIKSKNKQSLNSLKRSIKKKNCYCLNFLTIFLFGTHSNKKVCSILILIVLPVLYCLCLIK